MKKLKKYKCENCDRPINHQGKCLKCNSIVKHEREYFINHLLSKILNIEAIDHKKIQIEIKDILTKAGYYVEIEKKIKAKRSGKIDLFAERNNFSIGIEIDHSVMRWKSIDKLNTLKANLSIYILKSRNINIKRTKSRLNLIKTKTILIYLSNKHIRKINL
ncbi:hypothetical protein COT04_00975 [Candidatus Shapirobacteria bacterium CG07_land_8_20_14_0_80_39_12]|uniref:Uncharacterized protein n=1 Tax=Candidatus Shapirobacteria bacterium CG07_land_8_20_14_0_80_39_12 TaxID=1974480 RepID=A0A2M6YQ82_9BACT|nr:MAG: hypothetical protein COT04_00975 [Candidatus Shapirobacteria bacterium CG07_land_8_20_14_0_80_39_12]